MSTLKQEVDLDIDTFLNLEHVAHPSPISTSIKGKAIATPSIRTPIANIPRPLYTSQQTFAGPSHQYDLHKQQTGIPLGAFAGAAAPRHGSQFGGFSHPFHAQDYLSMNEDSFDFNSMPIDGTPSFGSAEIDMDFDSPIDGMFPHASGSEFVDPHAIGGEELNSPPTPVQREIVRIYPGMHSQQAALAKQQQQQEIQRQQQLRATQHSQPTSSHKRTGSRTQRPPTDPIVEDRISRLLSQMRQGSVGSSNNDPTTPQALPHVAKSKKDEEDMDEDERLLASEEGKKLSSKERRQLRNKVSARAFRSRRKEYIGQLEGEIANKSQEADDLRAENEGLKAENTRLTDLTRMLLSSSAFSTFLQDLSANGVPTSPASLANAQSHAGPTPQQQPPKDVNVHQQHQVPQNNPLIGMTLIPETTMDFAVEPTHNWGVGMDYGFNAQVFSVMELPEGPAIDSIDTSILSGKGSSPLASLCSEAKDDTPTLESLPAPPRVEETAPAVSAYDEDVDFDESDPAYALFADAPSIPNPSTVASEPEYQMFGHLGLEKVFARIDLVIENEHEQEDVSSEVSAATMARFYANCSALDVLSERISNVTRHLRW